MMSIMEPLKSAPGATKLTFLYCLPAILAISIVLGSYYERTGKVVTFIETQRDRVERAYLDVKKQIPATSSKGHEQIVTELQKHKLVKQILEDQTVSLQLKRLIEHYVRQRLENIDTASKKYLEEDDKLIKHELTEIWISNSGKIAIFAIFPFLLLGTHLGFATRRNTPYAVRASVVNKSWWIKFLIGLILAYGWVYVLNPTGRGTGAIEQFLISVDLSKTDSLPDILKGGILQPIIAGFLGWYLYMLTYFFSKVFTHDVLSTNSYGLMFQKLLFTYGVAIILPSVQATTGATSSAAVGVDTTIVLAFLVGFFPMSAFSMLKDTSLKVLHGTESEKGQLQELPGISRWQILRLEEEGIDSIGALAAHNRPEELRQNIPAMSNLICYWVDIARLYTILGQETYLKLKKHCRTASEFLLKANDQDFINTLAAENITNTQETARILKQTFPEALSYTKPD